MQAGKRLPSLPRVIEIGSGRTAVRLELSARGRDLLLTIGGGDTHVGAVAVASESGGTAGESCRASLVVPGHREGPLAVAGAEALAEASGRTCVAVVGVHQDAATPSEIADIVRNVQTGIARLARDLRGAKPTEGRT